MYTFRLIILGAIVANVVAQMPEHKDTAEIITEKTFVSGTGYNFEFKTSDGVSRKEEAQLITVGDHQGIGVKGSYSYTAPNGQEYVVSYTADDKGYKPEIRVAPQNKQ